MEIEETPYIGFPLGLALLVFLLFFICCFFCCCLYWDKLQFLFPSSVVNVIINPQPRIQPEFASSHHKPGFPVLVITSLASESDFYFLTKKTLIFSCVETN